MNQQMLMLIDGSVYSSLDPYATAMLVQGSQIRWVGTDAGAESIFDTGMTKLQLGGKLVTPGFVMGATRIDTVIQAQKLALELLSLGYTAVTAFTPSSWIIPVQQRLEEHGLRAFIYAIDDSDVLGFSSAHGVFIDPLSSNAAQLVERAVQRRKKVSFQGSSTAAIDAALKLIAGVHNRDQASTDFRIDGVTTLTDQHIDVLGAGSVAIGFSAQLCDHSDALRRAISAGVTTFIGSDPLNAPQRLGWEFVRGAVIGEHNQNQISARAAFNAMTRGVYRALGEPDPTFGQLVMDSPADFALWRVDELMVQVPDIRISSWSTDPRARTPLLPALKKSTLPACAATYCKGQLITS